MSTLKVATFNCAGLGVTIRRRTIFDYLRTIDAQILCLQETHSTALDENKWASEWGKHRALFHSHSRNDRSNGVAFLLNHSDLRFTNWYGDETGRILSADFDTPTDAIHIVNIYAPQCGRPARERALFFDSIYLYLCSPHPTLLAGDFNCVENSTLDRDPPSNRPDSTASLRDLCETFELQDTLRVIHGNMRLFTRRQGDSQSRIDRFYVCPKITPLSERTLPGLASDHDVVVLGIKNATVPKRGKGRWKNNVTAYDDPAFRARLQYKWRQWQALQPYLYITKTDWWLHTKSRLQGLLIDYAKARKSAERRHEVELQRKVETLCKEVNDRPTLLPLYHRMKSRWCELKKEQTNARIKKSRLKAYENNVRGTKEFFQQYKQHRLQTSIIRLQGPEGESLISRREILQETQRFFQALYQRRPTCQEAQNVFLRHITQTLDPQDNDLTRSITKDEIHSTISQFKPGKSPGPDGLTIEFYKSNWTIIAQDLTDVFNEIHSTTYIPKEMKLGCITLIHKKNTTELLQNYRPISLLNTDLKIYTKLLANRLKKSLHQVINAQQYARPGSQLFHVLTLLRDMQQHSSSRGYDHFYISLDFEKAFDSIDHKWLLRVLTRFGFSPKFVQTVATLYFEATSEVSVNGFRTRPFTIERGVRQGDPLSLFLFLIAVEPFLIAVRNDNKISHIQIPGRFKIKTLSYADDITLTISDNKSVLRVFEVLQSLEDASGLRINQSKTCGMHTAKKTNAISLPRIQWEEKSLHLLGSSIGAHESVASLWDKCIRNITATAKHYSTFFLTWAAKSLIVKSKMLPLVTYIANAYPPPPNIKQRIYRIIEKFITGYRDITLPISILARPLHQGGYNIPDIPLYCNIFFLRPILDYVKHRLDFTPATPQNAMVEFHIGHQLSKLLDLPQKNYLPHTVRPNIFYAHALALVKKYKLTAEHLQKSSIKQLYEFLNSTDRPHTTTCRTWLAAHNPILSNSLQTFNYRAIHDVLPVATKFHTAHLDPKSTCRFCHTLPEKLPHILFTCHQIKPVWTYIQLVINHLDASTPMDLNYSVTTQLIIPPRLKHLTQHIIYLFSITRNKIWTHRNNIEKRHTEFSSGKIIRSIISSTRRRLSMENQTAQKTHAQVFDELSNAMSAASTHTFT